MARGRYRSNFPWLSSWLKERKMEASRANYVLGEIMPHDVLALNLSFDSYFRAPTSVPS